MGLTITSKLIRSSASSHTAELEDQALADAWSVSWLSGRVLTGRQASAAMEIADAVGQIPADCDPEVYDDKFWGSRGLMVGRARPARPHGRHVGI